MQCDVTDLKGNHCPEEAVHTVIFKGVETHLCERCHANVLAGAYGRHPIIDEYKGDESLKTAKIEIKAKGIESVVENWKNETCVRCGRPRTWENMKHTRLYGLMCLCGSQEWKAAEHRVNTDKGDSSPKAGEL